MAGAYNPNKELIQEANKAIACGMSYGKWVAMGRPEPKVDGMMDKLGCLQKFRKKGVKGKG